MLISSCVDAKLRKSMTKSIERLGGNITASPDDFTVFVTLEAAKGQKERGFIKSLNTLSALASGAFDTLADGMCFEARQTEPEPLHLHVISVTGSPSLAHLAC